MKSAKDFDVDYQTTLTDLQSKLEEALKEKQGTSVSLQKEEDGKLIRFITLLCILDAVYLLDAG